MLKFFWQLLVIGFPPKPPDCSHQWTHWEITSSKSNSVGDYVTLQSRRCERCGVHEFKKNHI